MSYDAGMIPYNSSDCFIIRSIRWYAALYSLCTPYNGLVLREHRRLMYLNTEYGVEYNSKLRLLFLSEKAVYPSRQPSHETFLTSHILLTASI